MVAQTMDGPLRDHVLQLMTKKDQIEAEIASFTAVLNNNGVGMNDSLIDEEDYPRSDIDIYQVRNARHQIIRLQNDHKALMSEIEKGLHKLHASQRDVETDEERPSTSFDNNVTESQSHMNGHASNIDAENSANNQNTNKSIVKVNFVSVGSPADEAGIKVDDEIIEFGSINAQNFNALTQIAEVVQHSVNLRIRIKILRNREIINLSLTPRSWNGRGLLGCNIIPINND